MIVKLYERLFIYYKYLIYMLLEDYIANGFVIEGC